MSTIHGTVVGPDEADRHRAVIRLEVAGTDGIPIQAWTPDDHLVGPVDLKPDADGRWEAELVDNADLVPSGTRWKATVTFGDEEWESYGLVDGDANWAEILTPAPGAVPDPATAFELVAHRGAAGGYAALDDDGIVPLEQLPAVFVGGATGTVDTPALVWTMSHALGFHPGGWRFVDEDGAPMEPDLIEDVTANVATATWRTTVQGTWTAS